MNLLLSMGEILHGDECCPTANKDPSPASEAHKLQLVEINYSNANGLSTIFFRLLLKRSMPRDSFADFSGRENNNSRFIISSSLMASHFLIRQKFQLKFNPDRFQSSRENKFRCRAQHD